MRPRFIAIAALAALLVETPALAETCMIEITGPEGQWKFVQVFDVATGNMVMGQAIRSGEVKTVTITGDQVRVDWKLSGYRDYRTGEVTTCRGGNRIRV
jgi:hypothetical protein